MSDKEQIVAALELAQGLADELRARLLEAFYATREATLKRDGTLVTQADLESDRLITETIQACFPEHEIVSEELKTFYEGARWCWVIDPLDGTTNFARGLPIWAISIALLEHGQPVMGLVDVPPLGLRYHAVQGGGAFENGKPIHVHAGPVNWQDDVQLQNELFVACTHTVTGYHLPRPLRVRALGAAAFNFCLVARGAVLAAMEATPKVWDLAAAWLLVREAGGVIHPLEEESLLPMVPGRDYARVMPPHLAAASESLVHELVHRISKRNAKDG